MEQLWKSSTDYIICTLSPSAVQLKNTFPRSQTKTEPYKIKETALFLFSVWDFSFKDHNKSSSVQIIHTKGHNLYGE